MGKQSFAARRDKAPDRVDHGGECHAFKLKARGIGIPLPPLVAVFEHGSREPRRTVSRERRAASIECRRKCCVERLSIDVAGLRNRPEGRSEEHTSELQSLMRISYAVL